MLTQDELERLARQQARLLRALAKGARSMQRLQDNTAALKALGVKTSPDVVIVAKCMLTSLGNGLRTLTHTNPVTMATVQLSLVYSICHPDPSALY